MNETNTASNQSTVSPEKRKARLFRHTALAVAVTLAIAGVTVAAKTTPTLPDAPTLANEQASVQAPTSFGPLIERVQPAVVNVAVTGISAPTASQIPDFQLPNNPYFKDFFERFFQQSPTLHQRHSYTPKVRGVGSGFIVTPDGYLVTSNHLVEDGAEIQVVLNDGKRLQAKVRGRDPKTDLALLKIEVDHELPYVVFGDSDSARPGDWVVAIGNPFGLGGTATSGIISARGRDIHSGPYDDYLQIDAPINRGNSGGPLFNLSGRVIGVNTAIFSPNGGNVGIGFAIPSAQAKTVIQELMSDGFVERGWLGVQIQSVSEALAEGMQLPHARGAMVTDVTPDSPAARANMAVGDVVLTFNDHEITDMRDLPKLVADVKPGQKVKVSVWRKGKQQNLEVSIAGSPEVAAAEVPLKVAEGPRLGLALAPMTEELRQRFNVPGGVDGALVMEIEPGSPAAREGMKPGDVFVQAGGKWVSEPADVVSVVREFTSVDQEGILLLLNRQGDQRFVMVQPG